MSETAQKLAEQFETFTVENEKFEGGNATAGTRARKALMEITRLAKARRAEITETKNARKEAAPAE